jgi:hypothetical protein
VVLRLRLHNHIGCEPVLLLLVPEAFTAELPAVNRRSLAYTPGIKCFVIKVLGGSLS